MGHQRDYSEEVAGVVDEEVKRLIETAHDEAWEILVENRDVLDDLVLELLEKETLDKAQVAEIFTDDPQAPGPAGVDRLGQAHARRPARCMTPKELASPNGVNGQDKAAQHGRRGPDRRARVPAALRRRSPAGRLGRDS